MPICHLTSLSMVKSNDTQALIYTHFGCLCNHIIFPKLLKLNQKVTRLPNCLVLINISSSNHCDFSSMQGVALSSMTTQHLHIWSQIWYTVQVRCHFIICTQMSHNMHLITARVVPRCSWASASLICPTLFHLRLWSRLFKSMCQRQFSHFHSPTVI